MSPLERLNVLFFSKFCSRFSWSAILFYMYTSNIQFAPLSSRGIEKAVTEEKEVTDGSTPTSDSSQNLGVFGASSLKNVVVDECSPKSVYSLANKVCSISLCLSRRYLLLSRLTSLVSAISRLIISSHNWTKQTSFKSCYPLSPLSS